ncbi:MAG TPA: methylamine utilization protein MauJ [Opitutaceae bacterium]
MSQFPPSPVKDRTWPPCRGRSRWLTVAVRDVVRWPDLHYFHDYDGYEFILLPETTTTPPAIALELTTGLDLRKARAAIRRFLSAYAWVERHSADDHFGIGAGFPGGVGKEEGPVRTRGENFRLDYLPSTQDPKARLCLALYREALGLRNEAYRFLAFFKIINVLHEKGAKQVAWINAAIPKLTDRIAMQALAALTPTQPNLGKYLYESGRCAVAHAFAQPVADPDDPADTERLSTELPIVRALAEHLMEHELGIKSEDTVHREHLYELAGFRAHLGPELVARLKAKTHVEASELPPWPLLSTHVRDNLPRSSFLGMTALTTSVVDGVVTVECTANPPPAKLRLMLDFPEERLVIDPLADFESEDDGSAQAMVAAMDVHWYWRLIFCNRIAEIWPESGAEAWGRTAPYVPRNMRFHGDEWLKSHRAMFLEYLRRVANEAQRPAGSSSTSATEQ